MGETPDHAAHSEIAYSQAAEWLDEAEVLVITAGAGMGVDSQLPDFRGDEGFWRAYPPYRKLGFNFMEMADPRHFRENPALAWGFYGHRLGLYRKTVPHEGFQILRRWAEGRPCFVVTSNVDGQFQKAGFAEEDVWQIHGSIHRIQCLANCTPEVWENTLPDIDVDEETMLARSIPSCPRCGAALRPNILMFGDGGYNEAVSNDEQGRWNGFFMQHRDASTVVVEMGAGTAIPSIRRISEYMAQQMPAASLIRINPREAQIPVDVPRRISLADNALTALKAIDSRRT